MGRHSDWFKEQWIKSTQGPRTMYHALHVIKNSVESSALQAKQSSALQANSCDNLNKGYCKLGQVKGDCNGRETANSYAPPHTCPIQYTCVAQPWIHDGTRVCKEPFQGAASLCSRWPIASFTLPGLMHPVRLNPVYPCILGQRDNTSSHSSQNNPFLMLAVICLSQCRSKQCSSDLKQKSNQRT